MAVRGCGRYEHREGVQIGTVRFDAGDGFAERDALEMLVRSTINPKLPGYFIQLTGIGNEALGARGVTLEVSFTDFARFADGAAIPAIGVTLKTGGVIPCSLLCFFASLTGSAGCPPDRRPRLGQLGSRCRPTDCARWRRSCVKCGA